MGLHNEPVSATGTDLVLGIQPVWDIHDHDDRGRHRSHQLTAAEGR
jgi:hypothetical protein